MSVDLSCEFMHIKLKNPFLIASVPATSAGGFSKAAKAGWAGGVHWGGEALTGGSWARGYIPREFNSLGKSQQCWAYENSVAVLEEIDHEQHQPPERVEKLIRQAKESGIVVGCNIFEGKNPEAWGRVAAAAERGGADFLELNWSCPYLPETGLGIGLNREKRIATLKSVRENCELPVMVKLGAALERDMLAEAAIGAVESGANAISITNTFTGLAGVDIETGMPISCELGVDGKLRGMIGGISGPAIKPMGLRGVAEVRQATDVPISAIGGITDWQSAVEYMLLGASTVQVGTAVMLFGYRVVREMTRGLEEYMERKGYKTINDFIGITTDKYLVGKEHVEPAQTQPRKMVVDEDKCTGCGLCLIACEATSDSGALRIEDRVAKIDHSLCHSCNSCRTICPEGAITLEWDPRYLV